MPIRLLTRYGAHETIDDRSRYEEAIRDLVAELCREEFPRPDYEHSRVSVSLPDGWLIEASMDGLVVLDHLEGDEPVRFLDGLSKGELTALMLELARGHLEAVRRRPWVDRMADLCSRSDQYLFADSHGATDLHRAAAKGDRDWLRSQLSKGAAVDARDGEGATPLHWAALAGWPEACKLLLAAGADPEAEAADGYTPIDAAGMSDEYLGADGATELVRVLRKRHR
ncbi:MAG: ankyrin repeat domain-containing protein [Gemmataceae bacterium]|nr:ankyrin repeat domain-containing protein [Gemmataceae bacterium]